MMTTLTTGVWQRVQLVVLAVAVAAGCSSSKNKSPDKSPDRDRANPADAGSATAPDVVAPLAPMNTRAVPDKWWENPAKHCPPGMKLGGKPPAKGHSVWCWDDEQDRTGPRTGWHRNGKKAREGWEKNSKTVGVWTYWYEDGKKHWTVAFRDDGSQDGTYRHWAPDGKLIGEYTLIKGNGQATGWSDDGKKIGAGEMKNGRKQGLWTGWHTNGTKSSEISYRNGKAEGTTTRWDDKGRKILTGNFVKGRSEGKWIYYDVDKAWIKRVVIHNNESQNAILYYQDGKQLGPNPPADKCPTDDDVSKIVEKATGRSLDKRHRCVSRSSAFPGVIAVGGFASDRGCIKTGMLLDCVYAKSLPAASQLLARVGWKQANADNRKAIAMRYIREIDTTYRGHPPSGMKHYTFTAAANGGLMVSVWLQRPSGMRRGWTKDRYEYTFTAAGDVTAKKVEIKSGGR